MQKGSKMKEEKARRAFRIGRAILMSLGRCPSTSRLVKFHDGQLVGTEENEAILQHIKLCHQCCEMMLVLSEADRTDDAFGLNCQHQSAPNN